MQKGSLSSVPLVLETIESLDELSVLFLLAEHPMGCLTSEVLDRTTVRPQDLESVLATLADKGLITSPEPGIWRLSSDRTIASEVTGLLSQYRANPVPLLRMLSWRCVQRIRELAARSLADAFVLRRRETR